MKICIAVSEFNPFHSGHARFLERCRTLTGADAVVCLMSGNFTQRGDFAVMEKRKRAEIAVKSGADAVFELPSPVAVAPAERFAKGAVSLLKKLAKREDISLSLCFGTETGTAETFLKAAEFFAAEPAEYQTAVKAALSEGLSLPAAREKALSACAEWEQFAPLIQSPNATLGLEYAKAAKAAGISVYCYPRGGDYNQTNLPEAENCISASAVRAQIAAGNKEAVRPYLPPYAYEALPSSLPCADLALFSTLLSCKAEDLKRLPDCTEGLENRILTAASTALGWEDFLQKVKTKRYVLSRIKRIAVSAFLGVEESLSCQTAEKAPYLRLLALKKGKENLLSVFPSAAPLLTRAKDADRLTGFAAKAFAADRKAETLYRFLSGEEYPFFLSVE